MNAAPKRISPRASGNGLPSSAVRIAAEVVGGCHDQVEPAAHDRGPLLGGLRGPGGQRGARGVDRPARVLPRRARNGRDRRPGRGVDDVEAGVIRCGDPCAGDEEVGTEEPRVGQAVDEARRERRDRRRVHRARFADRAGNRNANRPRRVGYSKARSRRPRAPSSTSMPSPGASGMSARPSSAAGVPVAMRSAAISLGR